MEVFEYRNVVIETPNSAQAEAYRKLELNIRMSSIDKEHQVIQVTSATPEDGKTTTAINLAAVYAEKGKKVLILDFDFRRPKIHRAFHKINNVGFYDFIIDNKAIDTVIIKDESKIDLVLTGNQMPSPHVMLQSKKVSDLIESLRSQYDYIIVDSPPVLTVTDALIISHLVDAVIYVVAYKQTKKDKAKQALNQLKENNANVIGTVLSNIDIKKNSEYSYYYYYNQGENK